MLKGLHLLAAIFIVCMLGIYFNIKSQNNIEENKSEEVISQRSDMSPYEAFCANNKNINCPTPDKTTNPANKGK